MVGFAYWTSTEVTLDSFVLEASAMKVSRFGTQARNSAILRFLAPGNQSYTRELGDLYLQREKSIGRINVS